MMQKWLTRGLPLLGLLSALVLPAHAAYPEFEGVQSLNADPSPTAFRSNVDNYTFQDEQINIKPTDGLIKVLRTNQKIEVNDYVTKVFPLNHADRREIRNVFRMVTKLEGGRAEVYIDKEGSGQSFIQVIAPDFMMPYIADAVKELDVPWLAEYNDGAVDSYFQVKYRKAADVDLIASNYAGDEGFSSIDTTNNALRRFDEEYRNNEYIKAAELVDKPCNQVMLEVKIYEVAASNDLKLGLDYVSWSNGPGRNLFSFAEAGYSANQRAQGLTSVFDPFIDGRSFVANDGNGKDSVLDVASNESARAVNYLLPSSYVDFLQTKGVARVIKSQSLLLCSANSGMISSENQVVAFVDNMNEIDAVEPEISPVVIYRQNIGSDFDRASLSNGYLNYVPENGFGGQVPVGSSPSYVAVTDSDRRLNYVNAGSTGISMEMTPFVGLESMELELNLAIGELNGLAPNGTPIINTRTVNTTVRLLDGQPFVIAGIKKINTIENSAKAPFLGSLPVVGYLFGGEQDTKRQSDVVVTITPKFYTSSQISIATPPQIDTMSMIVEGTACQGAPDLKLGFDQYLIGG